MEKKKYTTPQLQLIELDNEISLALESNPPAGPDEGFLKKQNGFNNDPFNNNFG